MKAGEVNHLPSKMKSNKNKTGEALFVQKEKLYPGIASHCHSSEELFRLLGPYTSCVIVLSCKRIVCGGQYLEVVLKDSRITSVEYTHVLVCTCVGGYSVVWPNRHLRCSNVMGIVRSENCFVFDDDISTEDVVACSSAHTHLVFKMVKHHFLSFLYIVNAWHVRKGMATEDPK